MTECNGCGACCHPFTMPVTPQQLRGFARRITDGAWMVEHLTPIRRRDGMAMAPWSDGYDERLDDDGTPYLVAGSYYRCDNYDETTRRCLDYNNRPSICRQYPWVDGIPQPTAKLPPTCSFNADIGLPVEPVPVAITRRQP